ncbi:MAG TPA: hypothetical protein VGB85_05455, partial [Nannocystis sp.]
MAADDIDARAFEPAGARWLARIHAALAGPGPAPTYLLTRFVLLRVLGLVYLAAFLSALLQLVPLVGADGLTPAVDELAAHADAVGGAWSGFLERPTLFWLDCSDGALWGVSLAGVLLSCVLLLGCEN